ncbi:hypothetical protein [Streptomyces sp. NPDC059479]|uniref:hypothetical protein n=1 Tax=Streptomyces sp. NPDC059479 TaxID=3346848 RepID=UPI003689B22E
MKPSSAAILPSRNEPATIAAVTAAVDAALNDPEAVIVSADSSDHPATADRFTGTPTRARKISLIGLPRGKGAQILHALPHIPGATGTVLIADTDTLTPEPDVYRALLARAGTGCSIADYPRYWDEANLTSHLARPLIAATTGHDVPQPLAGDLALSVGAVNAVRTTKTGLRPCLATEVDGYGIDAFLLLAAARTGPITSVPVRAPKRHAPSFSHLPQIYAQAVPVLLSLTATSPAPREPRAGTPLYRPADRILDPDRRAFMIATLDELAPALPRYEARPWPLPVADAWRAVRNGESPHKAARTLWPYYIHRVRTWLATNGQSEERRARDLAEAQTRLIDALTTDSARRHIP